MPWIEEVLGGKEERIGVDCRGSIGDEGVELVVEVRRVEEGGSKGSRVLDRKSPWRNRWLVVVETIRRPKWAVPSHRRSRVFFTFICDKTVGSSHRTTG